MSKVERQHLIDSLSEFIPSELESTEEEKVHILIVAVGAQIRSLKERQGSLIVASKLAADPANHVAELTNNKEQLNKLFKDWKLLGGDQQSEE